MLRNWVKSITLVSSFSRPLLLRLGQRSLFRNAQQFRPASKSILSHNTASLNKRMQIMSKHSLSTTTAHQQHLNELLRDAIEKRDETLISAWLDKDADVNVLMFKNIYEKSDVKNMTALMYILGTSYKDKIETTNKIINKLVSKATPDYINFTSNNNDSALHTAAIMGYKESILALLKHGANPNLKTKDHNKTPYDYFIRSSDKDKEVIQAFIKYMERPALAEQVALDKEIEYRKFREEEALYETARKSPRIR